MPSVVLKHTYPLVSPRSVARVLVSSLVFDDPCRWQVVIVALRHLKEACSSNDDETSMILCCLRFLANLLDLTTNRAVVLRHATVVSLRPYLLGQSRGKGEREGRRSRASLSCGSPHTWMCSPRG